MQIENLYNGTEQVENNITYSIDMIRLKTYISYSKFTEIEFRFATCWKKYLKKNFSSALLKNFFYNYVIEIEEGISFWFGFLHKYLIIIPFINFIIMLMIIELIILGLKIMKRASISIKILL